VTSQLKELVMINKRLGGLMAAGACVALISAMPMARPQMAPTPLTPTVTPPATATPAPVTPFYQTRTQNAPVPINPPQTVSLPPVEVISNGPQVSPGDFSANWSPRRNIVESNQYERLLRTNPAFKQARIHKECGPITEPSLYQQCVASFE
jgi:hypothetical protein